MQVALAYLTLQAAGGESRVFRFENDLLRIGRAQENDVVLNDDRVSRLHASISFADYRYVAQDLHSRNGTFLNGKPLSEPSTLSSGDIVSIADYELLFTDPASTAVGAPARPAAPLVLDDRIAEVRVEGEVVDLAPKEYTLLRLLLEKNGQLAERDEIVRTVWPEHNGVVSDFNIDNLVARLRPKIERPGSRVHLVAIKKRGYRLLLGERL
ncbi:MAG TPA: FHA domain-containing protein [Chloroflexota bacterium]|nr:FHA domain-containing protein [Chloroflexota bacterium]